jgi:excisionase family DNA binding protein
MSESPLLTVAAVAAHLGLSDEVVLSHIRAGHLRAANVARPGSRRPRWRIDPDDVDLFLAARSAAPARPPPRRARRRHDENVTQYF